MGPLYPRTRSFSSLHHKLLYDQRKQRHLLLLLERGFQPAVPGKTFKAFLNLSLHFRVFVLLPGGDALALSTRGRLWPNC